MILFQEWRSLFCKSLTLKTSGKVFVTARRIDNPFTVRVFVNPHNTLNIINFGMEIVLIPNLIFKHADIKNPHTREHLADGMGYTPG